MTLRQAQDDRIMNINNQKQEIEKLEICHTH